jgi:alpha-ketoglutarate-dependent taurine dioxygenase
MGNLQVRDLSPSVGAEIQGFDPRSDLDEATRSVLTEAFFERGVLVFRDIDLDSGMQHRIVETLYAGGRDAPIDETVASRFSYVSNTEPDGGAPYGRLLFHSDMMWSEFAWQIPSLYAVVAEQPSVPTVFTSTTYAWETLPDELRKRVEGLHARHESGQQGRGDTAYEDELIQPQWSQLRSIVTPVAMRHPHTDRTMLYVCEQQTREIVELVKNESDELLDALFAHLYRPDHLLEHHWKTGDLVVWDNQAVQHGRPYVVAEGPARTLRKIHAPSDLRARVGAPTYERAN